MIRQIAMVPLWLALAIPLALGFALGMSFRALDAGIYFGRKFLESESERTP